MSIEEYLNDLRKEDFYRGQIIFQKRIPAKSPMYGDLDFLLDKKLSDWISEKNLRLYSHQADALNLINKGKNVVITTPTASGKTLIFSLAVANSISKRKLTTALFLYPTKALANDQLEKLKELNSVLNGRIKPYIYDGDTPSELRPGIRTSAQVIISNPYAFHQYLDWHHKWDRFFRNLRFIVIDETHWYRGVFGSNVAQLIRRLKRIISFYGAMPQFILSSATINNPKSFVEKLIGESVEVVDNNGAESAEKHIILWNPPYIDKFQLNKRSPHQETRDLLGHHLNANFQTLCFTLSRRMAEIITLWLKEDMKKLEQESISVMAYRAGYRPSERREIETKLRSREIQGVISTNALEVGIDIGSLDAVILSGFPGTIISTWQMFGRVGRTSRASLASLVLFEDAYQQFLGKHPKYFMDRHPENAIIDLQNRYILRGHILCAARELPLKLDDLENIWGKLGKEITQGLLKENLVKIGQTGISTITKKRPASFVSLNSAFTDRFEVIHKGKILETLTIPQLYREAPETGTILIHQGETYLIESVDWKLRKVYVSRLEVNYYTESLSVSDVMVTEVIKSKDVGFNLSFGEVKVTEIYHSYRKKTYDEVLEIVPLNLPPLEFFTKAIWIEIPKGIVDDILESNLDFSGGMHGLEHATIALSPMFAMCEIFIYDGFPGGIGISEKLFTYVIELLECVLALIIECPCELGCPSCIQSPKCGNDNSPLDKKVALKILDNLLTYRKTI
jgi:DEAD/DEAH box helicase domain-containing protein